MTVLYADASALARAYLPDETGHAELRRLIREDVEPVITSEVAAVEVAHAVRAAARLGRHRDWQPIMARFERETGAGVVITMIGLDPARVLPMAKDLVLEHSVGTLDAIHLAVALQDGRELGEDDLVFVTRDRVQARVARVLGLTVA
ncbi:MAG TPA: type II toxin-antitoxin system VapC family toxin [Actinomycetota bacterium]